MSTLRSAFGIDTVDDDLLAELTWRGLIAESSQGLEDASGSRGPISAYIGFDASARSLHVGHLLQVFMLTHLQRAGGTPFVVIGGGTGMIGDPSGKSTERNLLDDEQIRRQLGGHPGAAGALRRLLAGPNQAQMVDNREWLADWRLLDFLRDIGKHFSVPYMLAKDSVQARLASGMSFTEFSYMTLQSADFLQLYRDARRRDADGRRRPVGQHHRRPRADPAGRRTRGRASRRRRSRCARRCC